jgi:hypothetical protein
VARLLVMHCWLEFPSSSAVPGCYYVTEDVATLATFHHLPAERRLGWRRAPAYRAARNWMLRVRTARRRRPADLSADDHGKVVLRAKRHGIEPRGGFRGGRKIFGTPAHVH